MKWGNGVLMGLNQEKLSVPNVANMFYVLSTGFGLLKDYALFHWLISFKN